MDLTQFFLQQAQALQKQLQNLLEKSSAPNDLPPIPFEASTDLTQVGSLGIGLPESLKQRVPLLFSRLHPYFEAGVLFVRQGSSWCPQTAFQRGIVFILTPQETKMEFDFPTLTLTEVKKARSHDVLKDLGLEEYLNQTKVSTLVFSPHSDYLFLVLSDLADPWLKTQIDKIQFQSLLLLSDYI